MIPKDIDDRTRRVLQATPRRNPVKWRMEEGHVVILYRKDLSKIERKFKSVLGGPDHIRRPLDKYGTDIWLMCDGKHSILDICKGMDAKYKEEMEPVVKRVTGFLELLLKANLVSLGGTGPGPKGGKK